MMLCQEQLTRHGGCKNPSLGLCSMTTAQGGNGKAQSSHGNEASRAALGDQRGRSVFRNALASLEGGSWWLNDPRAAMSRNKYGPHEKPRAEWCPHHGTRSRPATTRAQ